MKQTQIQAYIEKEIYKDGVNGRYYIDLENSRLDFSQTYLFLGFTKSGNLKLGDITSYGVGNIPEKWRNKIGKVEIEDNSNGKRIKIWTDAFRFSKRIPITEEA